MAEHQRVHGMNHEDGMEGKECGLLKRLLPSFYLEGGIRRLHGEGKKPVMRIQKRLSRRLEALRVWD